MVSTELLGELFAESGALGQLFQRHTRQRAVVAFACRPAQLHEFGRTHAVAAKEFGRAAQVADRGVKVVSKVFFAMRLGNAVEPEVVTPVIEDIFASVQRNAHAFNGLMRCKRDSEYIFRHALATSALMITLGRQLGLTPEEQHRAGRAGLLLDSGISLLPVDVSEYGGDPRRIPEAVWRDHVWLGHDFILGSKFGDDVARAALEHHERMDGAGYPAGTKGAEISLLGRMAAICDTYDFLANDIAGGEGMDPATVLQTMLADTGAYDPEILSAFVAAMGLYPVGSVVELASGKLAMVVDQGEGGSAPRLRVFYSARLRQQVMQEDVAPGEGGDRIVGLADPATKGWIWRRCAPNCWRLLSRPRPCASERPPRAG